MKHIYLDYAAATPIDAHVLAAMSPYFNKQFFNPSATYLRARAIAKDLQDAREKVAQSLGVRPVELVFTAGGSEANNLAIHGIMRQFPGKHVVVGATEHASIIEPAKEYNCTITPVHQDGRIDLDALKKQITKDTVLISVMLANNEIGTITPLRKIADIVKNIRESRDKAGNTLPLYLHTDACQAVLYLDVHPLRLGVDLMTFNGGKIYGPKQSGVLYIKTGIELHSLIQGGGQERNVRSGTENVPSVIGFSYAFEKAVRKHDTSHEKLTQLQQEFMQLLNDKIPEAKINGSLKYRLPNNIHVTIPGTDNERVMMELDERGIECAVGSACSASSDEPSHVLKAIGLSDQDAHSSLRFTMGHATTRSDIATTVDALRDIVDQSM
jgi:cysteine desulfurase